MGSHNTLWAQVDRSSHRAVIKGQTRLYGTVVIVGREKNRANTAVLN